MARAGGNTATKRARKLCYALLCDIIYAYTKGKENFTPEQMEASGVLSCVRRNDTLEISLDKEKLRNLPGGFWPRHHAVSIYDENTRDGTKAPLINQVMTHFFDSLCHEKEVSLAQKASSVVVTGKGDNLNRALKNARRYEATPHIDTLWASALDDDLQGSRNGREIPDVLATLVNYRPHKGVKNKAAIREEERIPVDIVEFVLPSIVKQVKKFFDERSNVPAREKQKIIPEIAGELKAYLPEGVGGEAIDVAFGKLSSEIGRQSGGMARATER